MERDIHWSLSKAGLPLVTIVTENDEGMKGQLCFLIDTGATINIMYKFVCQYFTKTFIELEGNGSLIGFEGEEHKTQYIGFTFELEGKKYSDVFSVVEEYKGMRQIQKQSGIQVHGVLGVPFLVNNGWVIDFDKLVIVTKEH